LRVRPSSVMPRYLSDPWAAFCCARSRARFLAS
jgi:hypothetical protein